MDEYKIWDIVEIIDPEEVPCRVYREILGVDYYPLGTQFVIAKFDNSRHPIYANTYGLQLLIDGKPIPQDGRVDKCTVGIPMSAYRLVKNTKRKLLHNKIKDFV